MFKKSQLLAAVATAAAACFGSTASAADLKAAAYADLRYGLDYFNDTGPVTAGPADTSFNNTGTYYGFKGSAEQNGITVFGGYERWMDADQNVFIGGLDLTRQSYVGAKTEFGTIEYGTFESAYLQAGKKIDPFYATGVAAVGNPNINGSSGIQVFGVQSHGMSALTADMPGGGTFGSGGIFKDQLAYTSPSFFGVTVNAGVLFDNNYNATGNNQDDYEAGAEFNNFGITAGGQFIKGNSGNIMLAHGEEAYRVYGGYNQKRFGANVSAERLDLVGGAHDADYLTVSGWFGVLEGTRIAASYGKENETGTEGNSVRVGVFYDVLDNFTTHVAYRMYDAKPEAGGGLPNNADDQVVEVGATYRFEISGSASK